jgi:H+/gluconate symporter-like permease
VVRSRRCRPAAAPLATASALKRPTNTHTHTHPKNPTQIPEYGAQAALTALLLLSGNWLSGLVNLAACAYLAHLWLARAIYVDTTEAFRQLPQQKRQRFILLGAALLLFVLAVYRLIEVAIHTLLTPEGRALTQKLLHEAAASVHGY